MSSSFEKSVKGGTKVKLAPPKSKYVEHILLATQSGEAGVAEVFRTLTHPPARLDVDGSIQITDPCAFDDQGGCKRCNVKLSVSGAQE